MALKTNFGLGEQWEDDDGNNDSGSDSSESESDLSDAGDLTNDAADLLEAFLDIEDPKLTWKMIDFISKDEITELLLGYLSQMKTGVQVKKALVKDLKSNSDIYTQKIRPRKPFNHKDEAVARHMRMSYALMNLLKDSSTECVKSFMLLKIRDITSHALAVFHNRSVNGNPYHACAVLNAVMDAWPKAFFQVLYEKTLPKRLFRFMLMRGLHRGTAVRFLINLLSYTPSARLSPEFGIIKKNVIEQIESWNFLMRVVTLIAGENVEEEVAEGYYFFMKEFISKCAIFEESRILIEGKEELIIDTLLEGIADLKRTRSKWQRSHCANLLYHMTKTFSKREFIRDDPSRMSAMFGFVDPEPDPNFLHICFKPTLMALHGHISTICNILCASESADMKKDTKPLKLAGGTIEQPFTQLRLLVMKVLVAMFDLGRTIVPLSPWAIRGTCWDTLVQWVFHHTTNNMYLLEFRKLFKIVCQERANTLLFLVQDCGLVNSLIAFYNTHPYRVALHGFVLDFCWMVYELTLDVKDRKIHFTAVEADEKMDESSDQGDETGSADKDATPDADVSRDSTLDANIRSVSPGGFMGRNRNKPPPDQQFYDDLPNFLRSNQSWQMFFPILKEQIDLQISKTQPAPIMVNPMSQLESLLQNLIRQSLISSTSMPGEDGEGGDSDVSGDTDAVDTEASV